MATLAFTQEQFNIFRLKPHAPHLRVLAERDLTVWNMSSIIKHWADVGDEEPPHVRMFVDDSDRCNYAYLTVHGGFLHGNVYVIFDDNVINKYSIITTEP